jgi:hypothetical protein
MKNPSPGAFGSASRLRADISATPPVSRPRRPGDPGFEYDRLLRDLRGLEENPRS